MPFAVIDGIHTRYEIVGSGPPLLMFSPGGFDATLEKWSTLGVYARAKMMDHPVGGAKYRINAALVIPGKDPSHATSAARYLEQCLPRSEYWDVLPAEQTEANTPARLLQFLDNASAEMR